MAFDLDGARQAGYDDDEIADHLGSKTGFDTAAARKAGYSTAELLGHLTKISERRPLPSGVTPSTASPSRGTQGGMSLDDVQAQSRRQTNYGRKGNTFMAEPGSTVDSVLNRESLPEMPELSGAASALRVQIEQTMPVEQRFGALRSLAQRPNGEAARELLSAVQGENAPYAGKEDDERRAAAMLAARKKPLASGPGSAPPPILSIPDTTPGIADVADGRGGETAAIADRRETAAGVQEGRRNEFVDQAGRAATVDKVEAEYARAARKRFVRDNPTTASLQSGVATTLGGTLNAPAVAGQYLNELVVNPVLENIGLPRLPRVANMPGSDYFNKAAEEFTPQLARDGLGEAWDGEQFGKWLTLKMAAQVPNMAQAMVGAWSASMRPIVLPLMAGQSAGTAYQQGDSGSAAMSKGAFEAIGEMATFGVFDKVADLLKAMPTGARDAVVANAMRRVAAAGGAVTAQSLAGALEESVTQVGQNAVDIAGGKKIALTEGVGESALLGGIMEGAVGLPNAAAALRDPRAQAERQIAAEINGTNLRGANVDRTGNPNLRPTEQRKQTFDAFDDYVAEHAMPPKLVEAIKKEAELQPLAKLPGFIERAKESLARRGLWRGPLAQSGDDARTDATTLGGGRGEAPIGDSVWQDGRAPQGVGDAVRGADDRRQDQQAPLGAGRKDGLADQPAMPGARTPEQAHELMARQRERDEADQRQFEAPTAEFEDRTGDDLLSAKGTPWASRGGAQAKLNAMPQGTHRLARTQGGWVVKPLAPVDAAAHQAATSLENDLPQPTDGQKAAGNYKVGRVRIGGLDISIENPEGSVRRGADEDGTPWENTLTAHYGYVRGSEAKDGDHVDAFIKPSTPDDYAGTVFVVDQINPRTGKYDEAKAIIGAADQAEAEAIYRSNYADDWQGMGAITGLPMGAFRAWAGSKEAKKPLGDLTNAPKPDRDGGSQPPELGRSDRGASLRDQRPADLPDNAVAPDGQGVVGLEPVAVRPAEAGDAGALTTGLTVTFGGKTYPVSSVEDAQRKWVEFRDQSGGGVSEVGNGVRVLDGAGKFVARISYNGRVWDTEDGPVKNAKQPPATPVAEILAPVRSADGDGAVARTQDAGGRTTEPKPEDAHGTLPERVLGLFGKGRFGDRLTAKRMAGILGKPNKPGTTYSVEELKPALDMLERQGKLRKSRGSYEIAEAAAAPVVDGDENQQTLAGADLVPADESAFAEALGQARGEDERLAAMFKPADDKVVLPYATAKNPKPKGVEFITQAEAAKRLDGWKDEAARQGRESMSKNAMRTVISLFDVSGVIAQPWVEAGYNVVSYDLQTGADINEFDAENLIEQHGNDEVWAILAQPPCTDFANSGAQWWKAKDADGRTEASNELVRQTLRTIELFRPPVWVMENPMGRIATQNKLPAPTLVLDPWHFGDPYTKRTQLWGRFDPNLPTAMVEPVEGSKMHRMSSSAKDARSLTPEGFAYALFMANNAEAMPVGARMAQEFAGIERSLFDAAVAAGKSERDIRAAIEDAYYDNDLDMVREALGELAPVRRPVSQPKPPRSADTQRVIELRKRIATLEALRKCLG